ncbi:guanylate kinase [Candidatus Similichlamydia epinepheli]|uniref:guanylate kinase n=1 Tax=Candidatus Similichlamydia epinepheli TaxID=1903953 RepID=UPI00195BF090|nr:guanylate kinase [Candidatus Similichlamydia epinepheli]
MSIQVAPLKLFIISGPSGVGKTTLIQSILSSDATLKRAITCTTRRSRSNEIDGVDYFFIDKKTFLEWIQADLFVEWEEIYDNLYGVLRSQIDSLLREKFFPIVGLGTQGALSLADLYPCILIFLEPASDCSLKKRLLDRGEESKTEIKVRLNQNAKMMSCLDKYDYIISCSDLSSTRSALLKIIQTEKTSTSS